MEKWFALWWRNDIGRKGKRGKRSWKSGRGKTEICFSTWNQKVRVYGKLPVSGGFSYF